MSKKTGFSLPLDTVRDSESRKRQSFANIGDPHGGLNHSHNDLSSDNISLDSSIADILSDDDTHIAKAPRKDNQRSLSDEPRGRHFSRTYHMQFTDEDRNEEIEEIEEIEELDRIESKRPNDTNTMSSPYGLDSERYKIHYNALKELRLFERTDNVGTITRDHLANERTFLSFIRASLNLLICSITINQLYKSEQLQLLLDQIEIISSGKQKLGSNSDEISFAQKILDNNLRLSIKSIEIVFAVLGLFHCIIGAASYFINLNIMIKDQNFSVSRLAMLIVIVCILAIDILFLYHGIKGLISS